MNFTRRKFLASLFTILPAATSYKRVWKALEGQKVLQPEYIHNPNYVDTCYEVKFIFAGSEEAWIDWTKEMAPHKQYKFNEKQYYSFDELKESIINIKV